jgi:hypothetical protein
MTPHRAINWALAALIAAIATLGPIVMDSPSDIQAAHDTQASVIDAQAAAVQAAHDAHTIRTASTLP